MLGYTFSVRINLLYIGYDVVYEYGVALYGL